MSDSKRWFCVDRSPIGENYSIHYDDIWPKERKRPDIAKLLQPTDTRTLDELIAAYKAGQL